MSNGVLVTKENYPAVYAAFTVVAQDCGRINRLEGMRYSWRVPAQYTALLDSAEQALAVLDTATLDVFCVGEYFEAQAIEKQHGLGGARSLLDAFFEEWEETT